MIRLLILSGSPVEGSSTDLLLGRIETAFLDQMGEKADVETTRLRINDLDFKLCQSCGEAPEEGFCLFHDDLDQVYASLVACDCLLVGSPIYFDSVSAQMKMLIDRCNCIRPPDWKNVNPEHDFIKLLSRQRPGAMVLVGGDRGYFEGARRTIAGWFKWIEVVNEGHLMFRSTDFRCKGMVSNDMAALGEADTLGRRLADKVMRYE